MNRRSIAITVAILFALSWVFPLGAGVMRNPRNSLPPWWGTVDVTLAFVVALGAFSMQVLGHGDVQKQAERIYRIYRTSVHALLIVGVVVMLAGGSINWAECATGFLWRAWLFLYILPWWLAVTHRQEITESISRHPE